MITSKDNPHFKRLLKLHKKSARDETSSFLVEGERELLYAKHLEAIYYTSMTDVVEKLSQEGVLSIAISKELFQRVSYRGEGVIGIAKMELASFSVLKNKTLILLVEGIEKPGNLGAMLRTADAAGIDGIIVANTSIDVFNPNVIRASLGAFFTIPIVSSKSEEAYIFLQEEKIQIVVATPEAKTSYWNIDYTKPTCIVIGSEAFGVSPIWKNSPNQEVSLPMRGKIDSLNASVTAGILLYEVLRQRNTLS